MLILLIAAIFVFYTEMMPIKISTTDLIEQYSINPVKADQKFLDKELEITGTVKAYYKFLNIRNILELNNDDSDINLICFFLKDSDELIAAQLQQGDTVTIIGNCVGLEKYSFVDGLKIEVKRIK